MASRYGINSTLFNGLCFIGIFKDIFPFKNKTKQKKTDFNQINYQINLTKTNTIPQKGSKKIPIHV